LYVESYKHSEKRNSAIMTDKLHVENTYRPISGHYLQKHH